ncbi:MAG: WD40/YVTN/BNR-like repeat-containing protein [Rhodothermales bacterium]
MKHRYLMQASLFACLVLITACTQIKPDAPAPTQENTDPIHQYLNKEQQRAQWHQYERGSNFSNFDTQYRLKAFQQIQADSASRIITREWKSLGPHDISGRIISAAIHPTDENQIWAGSASGGLWKTDNGGGHWYNLTDNLPSMAVSTVAVHPENRDSLFIGTSTAVGLVAGLGINKTTAMGAGVFLSTNGGRTWREAGGSSSNRPVDNEDNLVNSNSLMWNIHAPDSVLLGSNYGLWIYKLSDDSWHDAFETAEQYRADNIVKVIINKNEKGVITVASMTSGVLRSEDHGKTWTTKNSGLPDFARFKLKTLTQSAGHPNIFYADIINNHQSHIYKSFDSGDSWIKVSQTPQFVQILEVSPFEPDLVFAGGVNLFRSTNGARTNAGATWQNVDQAQGCFEIVHVDQHGIIFSPENPELIYALTDGGIYRSMDLGRCWTAINTNLTTLQVYSIASSPHDTVTLSIGAQDQGTLLTSDQGKIWTKRITGDGGIPIFDPQSADIMYATAQFGNHWKLVKGKEPQRIRNGINKGRQGNSSTSLWIAPFAMDADSSSILFTATLDSIYRSVNGGDEWEAVSPADTVNMITTDIQDPAIVYAYAKGDSSLHRSIDRGSTWSKVKCNPCIKGNDVFDLEADPDSSGVLYAARTSTSDQLWRSRDAGNSWTNITTDTFNELKIPVQGITVTPQAGPGTKQIYVGTDIGVFLKQESMKDWVYMGGKLPPAIVTEIHYHEIDNTIRVATFGRGVWSMKALPSMISLMPPRN